MEQQLLLVIAIAAMVLSIVAVLVSIGTAGRVSQLAKPHQVLSGLQPGDRVAIEPIAKLVPLEAAEALLKGPSALVFASANCKPCGELLSSMSRADLELTEQTLLVVDTSGEPSSDFHELRGLPCTRVVDPDRTLRAAFKTNTTPTTYVISDGIVRRQVAGPDTDAIVAALSSARALVSGKPAETRHYSSTNAVTSAFPPV